MKWGGNLADQPAMPWPEPHHWLSLLVGIGFAGFAAAAALAFSLDTVARVAELRVEARRMQLRAMRERAKRLGR
jgi:hypothetical protein